MGYEVVNTRGDLTIGLLPPAGAEPVEWLVSDGPVAYDEALMTMTARAEAIAHGQARELMWLLEHPPLYTAGTSARPQELIEAGFPVHTAGRFVVTIEEWIIRALEAFNVRGERRDDRVGVWVPRPDRGDGFEDKIAAIGIRVRQWVTLHGFALNVDPDLSHFSGIVPCGVADRRYGVTSLADLGLTVSMAEADMAFRAAFEPLFGATMNPQALPSTENNSPRRRSVNSPGLASR
jgi:lipoyl(octanoyl) transferase